MNIAWTIVLISALTDFIITAGTALTTAMVAAGDAELPSMAVLIVSGLGGLIAFARTVQQALKAGSEVKAIVTGIPEAKVGA